MKHPKQTTPRQRFLALKIRRTEPRSVCRLLGCLQESSPTTQPSQKEAFTFFFSKACDSGFLAIETWHEQWELVSWDSLKKVWLRFSPKTCRTSSESLVLNMHSYTHWQHLLHNLTHSSHIYKASRGSTLAAAAVKLLKFSE